MRRHTAPRPLRARLPALLLLPLLLPGCLVLEERFLQKEKEADALREAVAQSNRKNAACEEQGKELSERLSTSRREGEELASKVKEQEDELGRVRGRLTETKKDYEGTTISREQLIKELLDKEKATGKKIQELALKASAAEERGDGLSRELDQARKDAAARAEEEGRLRKALEAKPSEEEVRRERDLLLGRLERLSEDRGEAAARRGRKAEALAETLAAAAPGAVVSLAPPFLRVVLPAPAAGGDGTPPKEWGAAAAAVAGAFREEVGCALLLSADGQGAEALRKGAVEEGRFPPERVAVVPPAAPGGAEILLAAP